MTYDEMETKIAAALDGAQAFISLMEDLDEEMLAAMTPDTAEQFSTMIENFGAALNDLLEIRDTEEFSRAFLQQMEYPQIAKLMLQIPVVDGPGNANPDAPPEKHFAVDVAEIFGPDWAQAWYRFIVLVTKLA